MRTRREFLVVENLHRRGLNDRQISCRTGIPRRTVSDWRRGKYSDRYRRRPGDSDDYRCIQKHDFSLLPGDRYAYLLGIYLGDGCISRHARSVYRMRVVLDAAYPEIIRECCASVEGLFPVQTAHRYKRRDSNCVEVSMYSKHWPCFFPQHGAGRKHRRPIRLAAWQQKIVNVNHKLFLRGLIHSDGTRIIATERKGAYVRQAPRYAFSNRSEDIKRLFCESCDALGIRWTRPSDHQIAIYRKTSVALLDEFIGPKR